MKPQNLFFFVLLSATPAWGMQPEDPLAGVEHSVHLELSPLSPSVTYIPLPTEQNSFVSELDGLSGRAPNFFVSSTSRHSLGDVYSVRGLTNGRLFTDPSVGLYVDGVPAGSAFTYAEPLYAVDHIDLFRSPQTTLYGLNSEGGLLEIHTRHADPKEWHGELSGLYGDFRAIEHRLWIGGPLIKDKLTLEISGLEATSQGFIDNTYLGGRRDDRETLAGRAVLTWTPTRDWEIIAGYEGTRARDGSSRFTRLANDPFQTRSDEEGSLRLNQEREWLTVGRKFDTWEIRSVTSHRSWDVNPAVQDLDLEPNGTRSPLVEVPEPATIEFFESLRGNGAVSRLSLNQEVWSQEFRVQSIAAAGAPWWRAGLFFQRERSTGQSDLTRGEPQFETQIVPLPPTRFFFPGLPAFGIPDLTLNEPNFAFHEFLRTEPLTDHTHLEQHEETWAAYLNAGHRWGAFALSGGLRGTYTRKTLERDGYTSSFEDSPSSQLAFNEAFLAASEASLKLQQGGAPGTPIDVLSRSVVTRTPHRFSAEDDDVNVTPSVGLTFDLPRHFQLFLHSSYVVKPGGFNPLVTQESISQYGREQIWATEAGVRAEAWHGRVQGQLTGYWNTIDDYQLDRGFPGYVVDAGRARSRGVELEVAVKLMPGLALSANIGWNDTELTQFRPDEQAPFVPRYTAFVALDYRHRCGFGAHLEFKGVGDTDYTATNLENDRQDAYGEMNARIGWEQNHYGLYLFGRNLTDTKHYTQKTLTLDAGSTGEPRILGMMAVLKF